MDKGIKIKLWCLLLIGWLHHPIQAQLNVLMEAIDCYQNRNLECARVKVDSAINHPETKDEPYAWTLRAYVYYHYFKNYEHKLYNSKYRQIAFESLQKSESLNPESDIKQQNLQLYKTMAESYYNQIKIYLYDSLNYEICLKLYDNFKKSYSIVSPNTDFKSKDIEFYIAVAGQYNSVVKTFLDTSSSDKITPHISKKISEYIEIAKTCFTKVLEIDPNNIAALKGMGVVYYNQGAKLVKELLIDTPIEQMDIIQENANRYFKQALPYLQKAYQINPNDHDVVEGLTGTYCALHETDKYIEFRKKLDEIEKTQKDKK